MAWLRFFCRLRFNQIHGNLQLFAAARQIKSSLGRSPLELRWVARREKSLEYRHGRIFPFEYRHGRTRSLITKEDHNQTMPTAKRSFRELDVTEQNETMNK